MFTTLSQIIKVRGHASLMIVANFNPVSATFGRTMSRGLCIQHQSKSDGITSAKMEVNGVQIHYETAGKGDHSVLLLPGAIGSTRTDFEAQLLTMNRDKFTVIAMDPRGYGKSIPPERDWPLEYLQRDAKDAATLIQNLGISRISLVGWSDGGIRAIIMAAHYPDLVHKMVYWGCNAYLPDDRDIYKDIRDIDKWNARMRQPFIDLYGDAYFRKIWNEWMDAFDACRLQTNGNLCIEDLPNVHCPTLILHGVKDPLVRIDSPEYLHRHTRNSRLVLMPEGKHNLHIQLAKEFNELVENFLLEPS